MSNPKRFLIQPINGGLIMQSNHLGDWVPYNDYKALEQRLNKLLSHISFVDCHMRPVLPGNKVKIVHYPLDPGLQDKTVVVKWEAKTGQFYFVYLNKRYRFDLVTFFRI